MIFVLSLGMAAGVANGVGRREAGEQRGRGERGGAATGEA